MAKIQLQIKYFNNTHTVPRKNKGHAPVIKTAMEKRLLKNHLGKWEWAIIYVDGKIEHYYYHTEGVKRLDNKQYKAALFADTNKINLYIVYKNGNTKTVLDEKVSNMSKYYNSSVGEVQAYQNDVLTHRYKNGQLYTS